MLHKPLCRTLQSGAMECDMCQDAAKIDQGNCKWPRTSLSQAKRSAALKGKTQRRNYAKGERQNVIGSRGTKVMSALQQTETQLQ